MNIVSLLLTYFDFLPNMCRIESLVSVAELQRRFKESFIKKGEGIVKESIIEGEGSIRMP